MFFKGEGERFLKSFPLPLKPPPPYKLNEDTKNGLPMAPGEIRFGKQGARKMGMEIPAWDSAILQQINGSWHFSVLDAVMPLFSEAWMLLPVLGLALLHVYLKDHPFNWKRILRVAALCFLAVIIAQMASQEAKSLTERARPVHALPDIRYYDARLDAWRLTSNAYPSGADAQGSSFFSGHAAESMALAGVLFLFLPMLRFWIWLVPFLCGYSRIYMGVHYPSDVLVGWLAGLLIALALWGLARERPKKCGDGAR